MRSTEDRFWAKVDTSGECWEWTAARNSKGYGAFWDGTRHQKAHRYSWELQIGTIPEGLLVCHKCDNPKCVRPDHLFLGTYQDNAIDAINKGRMVPPPGYEKYNDAWAVRGERKGNAIFTDADIISIRERWRSGSATVREMADQYGTYRQTIRRIVKRERWAHIP